MSKIDTSPGSNVDGLNVDFMRSLVKQYTELGQWTSAFFWADAAAAASGSTNSSGNDIWLLASTLLAQGEFHRAAHAVISRELHKRHLLCLGVAMRAYLAAKEPSAALSLIDECDPVLLQPQLSDQTHNKALSGVLVTQAKALFSLERREASAEVLTTALRADVACYEALTLLLEQHSLTPKQERELIESLPFNSQLGPAEALLVKNAYKDRLQRHMPINDTNNTTISDSDALTQSVECARSRTIEASLCKARRLATSCYWKEALSILETIDPWCCAEVRAACLVELKKSSELFVFAHTLVDSYPNSWTAWFAVGVYYYLIGKYGMARRYLSKAKSLEPGAGCIWIAYGHSFAADNEHDQATAAYFKASQIMPGSYLPLLYVGVENAIVNNIPAAQKFFARAALLHAGADVDESSLLPGWSWSSRCVSVEVCHEAAVAALQGHEPRAAHALLTRAVELLGVTDPEATHHLDVRYAATLDALGHVCRALGRYGEAAGWHGGALGAGGAGGPGAGGAGGLGAAGWALARGLQGAAGEGALRAHAALAARPDDPVLNALHDALIHLLDEHCDDEEVPMFPFPEVPLPSAPPTPNVNVDDTRHTDMSMSFD